MPRFDATRAHWKSLSAHGRFEQVVSWVLAMAIAVIIVVAVARLLYDIAVILIVGAFDPLQHSVFEMIFGGIMTVLIAIEFNHTILRAATRQRSIVQVRTVILVALLALARKIIILDIEQASAGTVIAIAGAVVALGATYWILREPAEEALVK